MANASFAKAFEARSGEQGNVSLACLQLGEARGDIAAKADDPEV